MGYYPILKTTWKYFPQKKGFLTGVILCVFGLCPMVFTSIADFVINPEGESMVDKNFRPEIAIKMKDFALIMSITMGIFGILSQLLMFPIDHIITTDETKKTDDNTDDNNKKESYISNEIYSKEQESENKTKEETESDGKTDDNEPFMQAFKSWRFHLFNFMSIGTLCNLLFI